MSLQPELPQGYTDLPIRIPTECAAGNTADVPDEIKSTAGLAPQETAVAPLFPHDEDY